MPRRPNIDRPVPLETSLPASIHGWLTLHLFSEVEGRVPMGAYQAFFLERIREYRETQALDLNPYGIEGSVRGAPEVIEALRTELTYLQQKDRSKA